MSQIVRNLLPNFLKFSISIFLFAGSPVCLYAEFPKFDTAFLQRKCFNFHKGLVSQKTETNFPYDPVVSERMTDSVQTTTSSASVSNDASTAATAYPELVLILTLKECIARKNDWIRSNGGDTSFTGAELARRLLSACGTYRKKEAEAKYADTEMETMREEIRTTMAVWICWRTIHASGKLPETALPMEAVDVIFSKVTEQIEQTYNISFEIDI